MIRNLIIIAVIYKVIYCDLLMDGLTSNASFRGSIPPSNLATVHDSPVVGSLGGYTAPNSGDQGPIKRLIRAPGEILYNFIPSGGIAVGLNNIVPASAAITFNGYDAKGARLYDATYGSLPGRLVDPILNIFSSRTRGTEKANPGIYNALNNALRSSNDPIYDDLAYWRGVAKQLVMDAARTPPYVHLSATYNEPANILNQSSFETNNIDVKNPLGIPEMIGVNKSSQTLSAPPIVGDALNLGNLLMDSLANFPSFLTTGLPLLGNEDLLNNIRAPDWRIGNEWVNASNGGLFGSTIQPTVNVPGSDTLQYTGIGFEPYPGPLINPPLTTQTTVAPNASVGSALDAVTPS